MSTINDPDILTQVPDELKKLAKLIIRGFYTFEHVLVIDFLVRNQIMKEDDMAELLKFDKKHLRLLLNQLKNDKIIKQTVRVETQPDGRTNRHNYYFINYKVFVNIVKYKLDKMRLKIESEERDSTCKALFSCPGCKKVYNDFDAMDLLDLDTGEMKCTHCGEIVQEDESNVPSTAKLQIKDFVRQVEPLYELLQQVEDIKLAPEILEPTPDVGGLTKTRPSGNTNRGYSGWSNSMGAGIAYNQSLTIEVGEADKSKKEGPKPKEMPVWLAKSTIDGAITEQQPFELASSTELKSPTKSHNSEEIMKTLLAHEKKGSGALASAFPTDNGSDNESDKSASDDEFTADAAFGTRISERTDYQAVDMVSDDDEEEDEEMMVTVNGEPMPFQDVTDDILHQMTPSEKENYIELGRRAYEAMYE
ncbi:general transcription factor IIE subunit 1-like [Anneissia japonica]|uniref:general transcription factor IIE subunit 1-like n=1 Tax=Anneissia japonica TaxID=1529436 RepID=UPI00142599B2|nr:general transcription factor IIE subunit 1-like [Anneissia japonica]